MLFSFIRGAEGGRSLRVRPRSFCAPLPPFGEAGWTRSGRPQLSKSLICESPQGRSLQVHPPSFCVSFFLWVCCGRGVFLLLHTASPTGRSLRVCPQSFCAPLPSPYANPGGEAFEYARRRFAPPLFFGCAAGGGGGRTNLNRLPVPEFHFNSRAHVGHDQLGW